MASKRLWILVSIQLLALTIHQLSAFPTPASADDKTVHNRELTEERPVQEQIAEADSIKRADTTESKAVEELSALASNSDSDDFAVLKSLAEKSKQKANETPKTSKDEQFVPDEADSTKSRRLADDYDSTKNGMDYKYQEDGSPASSDDPESFRQLDGTPLTADDIVQKIAKKIYEEDDRGVFDRIVSKLLKLGLITDSQADTLEYEVAQALQELITKNAKDNEIEEPDISMDYPISRGDDMDTAPEDNMEETDRLPSRRYDEDEDEEAANEANEDAETETETETETERDTDAEDTEDTEERNAAPDTTWDVASEGNDRNELSPVDSLQDLQYFPNFYRLLKSLDSEQDAEERETLITIMKTLIDFVKMMVKYGTITPEEGVSYLENLDAMIAMQTKNKLGKTLGIPVLTPPTGVSGKLTDEEDNTKAEAAKMQKEYEALKDSTKDAQAATETNHPAKSETYLEAIRKNIEWLKKHNKDGNKEDYDLSKLRDFMDQQVDSYIGKGILEKEEGEVIKRIYGSM